MKQLYWLLWLALINPGGVLAQVLPPNRLEQLTTEAKRTNRVRAYRLFRSAGTTVPGAAAFRAGRAAARLRVDQPELDRLAAERPDLLTVSLPTASGVIDLDLVPVELFSPTVKLLIGTPTGTREAPFPSGLFYQGVIRGRQQSLVALSLVNGELSGLVADEGGNHSLSRLTGAPDTYLFYADNTLNRQRPFTCQTDEAGVARTAPNSRATGAAGSCQVVNVYFETDYQTYLSNGASLTATTHYVANLFNQVAVLYNREHIAIRLAGLKVWTTTDPYASPTTINGVLGAFRTALNSSPPPGVSAHLMHLLSARDLGGGIAYLDVLCNASYKYGLSANLNPAYTEFPNYSWEVNVVAHELGHNFGSPHTHSCAWPGGPIDNCYAPEGSCAAGPAPTSGGTIMSYCQQIPAGINFANGFGSLPGNLIRSRFGAAGCLPVAGDVPSSLATKNIRATAATAQWVSNAGSTQFTVQYRPAGAATWSSAGPFVGPRAQLEGLQPSTTYVWRVTGACSTAYSAEASFTTGPPAYCTPRYSSNGCPYGIGLKRVVLNGTTLSSNSGCPASYYTYYASPVARLSKQTANTFAIDWLGAFNAQQLAIWIDFDNDYEFDETERVYATATAYTVPVSGTITLPASVSANATYRMRVRGQYFSPVITPCDPLNYGETEDYQVFVEPDCPPAPTIAASATAITCQQSATLSVTNCPGTVAWLPAGSGTSIVVSPTQTTAYTATCTWAGCSLGQRVVVSVAPDMVSLQSGEWTNAAIWSCGRVPSALTPLTVQAGHRITVPANYAAYARRLRLLGQLGYGASGRLVLSP